MYRFDYKKLGLSLVFIVCCGFADTLAAQPRKRVHAGKILVKLNAEAANPVEKRMQRRATNDTTSVVETGLKSFDKINKRFNTRGMRRLFSDAGKYEAKHRRHGLHLWYEMTIPDTLDPEAVAKAYSIDGNVQKAEPVYVKRSLTVQGNEPPNLPNDPDFGLQWYFHNTGQTGGVAGADIHLLEAWRIIDTLGISNRNVIVAVNDGGINFNHEDLAGGVWTNDAEANGRTGYDDDNNGYTDDLHGYNFVTRFGSATLQPEDHATHVAGVIAAVSNNSTGIAGMSKTDYGIRVMSVQIMNANSSAGSLFNAFTYAADNGAVISQNSWGYDQAGAYNDADIDAINYFIDEAGTDENGNPRAGTPMVGGIVIFAAGNDNSNDRWYPGYLDNVIAVGAINHYGKRADYSNYGPWVDIAAPGGQCEGNITVGGQCERPKGENYSTSYIIGDLNYYEYMEGTSMACPLVSGTAALILAVYGNERFTPAMLKKRLLESATPVATYDPDNANNLGSGIVNAKQALEAERLPNETINLNAEPLSRTSANLTWKTLQGPVAYYSIAMSTESINDLNFADNIIQNIEQIDSVEMLTFEVDGLMPGTSYHAAIFAVGNLGERTPLSPSVTFTTFANHAPELHIFADTSLIPTFPLVIDLSRYAFDADSDKLRFTAGLSSNVNADVKISNNILTINPKRHSEEHLLITASDPFAECEASVLLNIEQKYAPSTVGKLLLYPNPTVDKLFYSFIIDTKQTEVLIRISDMAGRVCYEISQTLEPANYYYSLDVASWPAGMYVTQYFVNGKKNDSEKFVKISK